jgi:hypothetical protein
MDAIAPLLFCNKAEGLNFHHNTYLQLGNNTRRVAFTSVSDA